MRFFANLSTIVTASIALVAAADPRMVTKRQEAARFGIVNTSPSGPAVSGSNVTITYNSTLAFWQPLFVDFYLEGTFSDGNTAPRLLISRNDYGADQKLLVQDAQIPDFADPLGNDTTYVLWAYVTFEQDGLKEIGGVAA